MTLGIGLIGTGFIGKAHATAYRSVRAIMGNDMPEIRLETLCDVPPERAETMARQFGYARATSDWRSLVSDPAIDVVSVATPNHLHAEIAIAALEAGKHVWCEKPMALTIADAEAMEAAARKSGKVTLVGYNYLHNPVVSHARKLIGEGRIGQVFHVRGWFDEDYQADADLPWSWRARLSDAGLGALGDMGCHLVSLAEAFAGPIARVIADTQIVHVDRPLADGSGRAAVENEDVATALVTFGSGAKGSLSTSRSAWGWKNRIEIEVHGTKGTIVIDFERLNELRLYINEGPKSEQGFKTILTSPHHPPFGNFIPSPGQQLGFLDLKTIEASELFTAITTGRPAVPSFTEALHIERVIHAIDESARGGSKPIDLPGA